jgi:hypothetical protein
MSDTPNIYTASGLARELGVSPMSITRLVHRRKVFPIRASSGALLFTQEQLETLRLHFKKNLSNHPNHLNHATT